MQTSVQQAEHDAIVSRGRFLSETSMKEGGFAEFFANVDGVDETMNDNKELKYQTAALMENTARHIAVTCGAKRSADGKSMTVDETTRSAVLGGFADYMLPAVRMAVPSNVLAEITSFQPTMRKVATITYLHTVIGRTRGNKIAGTRLSDALTGYTQTADDFTSSDIPSEPVTVVRGTTGASNDTITGTVEYASGGGIVPGTVQVIAATSASAGGALFQDDGRGGWISVTGGNSLHATTAASYINYRTGTFAIALAASVTFSTTLAVATYSYDMEGSPDVPEMDLQPEIDTVMTKSRKVRTNITREAEYDMQMEVGESAMQMIAEQVVGQLNSDVSREGIRRMWIAAGAALSSFSLTLPTGVSRQEHFDGFLYYLTIASNTIQQRTQHGFGNFLIVDALAASVIESMSKFEAAPTPANVNGVYFIGTLAGQYKVYKDIRLVNLAGSSSYGNVLMGYKGNRWADAGLVYAPYQVLVMTNPLETADFVSQRGFMTRYAMKTVNALLYARISLAA